MGGWTIVPILPPGPAADRPVTAPVGVGYVSTDVDGGSLEVYTPTGWEQVAAAIGHDHDSVYALIGHEHEEASGELLMQDGVTAPPVPVETEARDDWLYED